MDNLSDRLLNSLQTILAERWQSWASEHGFASWCLSHPFWTLGLLFVVLVLFAGLVQALGRAIEQFWIELAQLPILLFRLAWRRSTALTMDLLQEEKAKKRSEILTRLAELRTEEQQLLEELQRWL